MLVVAIWGVLMRSVLTWVVGGVLALSFGQRAWAQSGMTTPMAQNGKVLTVSFQPYGEMKIAAMLRNVGGKTAVCGMWTESERFQAYIIAEKLDARIRSATRVTIGNQQVIHGVGFMKKVPEDAFGAGTQVPRKITGLPWQAGFANQGFEMRSPRIKSRS